MDPLLIPTISVWVLGSAILGCTILRSYYLWQLQKETKKESIRRTAI